MTAWAKLGSLGFRAEREVKEAVDRFIAAQKVKPRPSQVAKEALRRYMVEEGFLDEENGADDHNRGTGEGD